MLQNYKNYLPELTLSSLERLIEGNKRFTQGVRSIESFSSTSKLKEFAEKGQAPFSIILTCSDSRIPTETIFDCGLGELFVVRVAGNIISPDLIASIEYAAENFKTPLCVVMGHTGCGAVRAAVDFSIDPEIQHSVNVRKLIQKIMPAVKNANEWVKSPTDISQLARTAEIMNIKNSVMLLNQESALLKNLTEQGKFAIVGANCDLYTGEVQFHPESQLQEMFLQRLQSTGKYPDAEKYLASV